MLILRCPCAENALLDIFAGIFFPSTRGLNYVLAYFEVNERYIRNPHRIVQSLLVKMRALKPIPNGGIAGLHTNLLKSRQIYRQLQSNGLNVDALDVILQFNLIQPLDTDTRVWLEEKQLERRGTYESTRYPRTFGQSHPSSPPEHDPSSGIGCVNWC